MDEISITLPVSGKEVIIRNYTTVGDDEKSEECLYAGVVANPQLGVKAVESFPLPNLIASEAVYVRRLIKSIDGDSNNISTRLKELRTEDGEAISESVRKIVEEHSPKAKKPAKNN